MMFVRRDKKTLDLAQSLLKSLNLDIDRANRYLRLSLFDSMRIAQASAEMEEERKKNQKKK